MEQPGLAALQELRYQEPSLQPRRWHSVPRQGGQRWSAQGVPHARWFGRGSDLDHGLPQDRRHQAWHGRAEAAPRRALQGRPVHGGIAWMHGRAKQDDVLPDDPLQHEQAVPLRPEEEGEVPRPLQEGPGLRLLDSPRGGGHCDTGAQLHPHHQGAHGGPGAPLHDGGPSGAPPREATAGHALPDASAGRSARRRRRPRRL
mmetsp:Transcript_10251/g.27818  ORF Transcript_10251/g.27818 Transcript_10251/m.27818 type:complete len:201 (-) Transcript_10251:23-625(-)